MQLSLARAASQRARDRPHFTAKTHEVIIYCELEENTSVQNDLRVQNCFVGVMIEDFERFFYLFLNRFQQRLCNNDEKAANDEMQLTAYSSNHFWEL